MYCTQITVLILGLIVGASYVTEEDPVCRIEYDTVAFYEQHCQTTFLKRPANKFLGRTASRFPRRAARRFPKRHAASST